ncbi:uncharacterized protein PV06_09308 [Exophiala oligosperma]|uniref:Uncharacterized protein n=2 Tax=Chaetothyriales TaxID=34395 RepID=A0A0D2ADS7_9EURO|nr:uncharacterized protein PV06_09308 [Exophiala oligosperma]KAJ9635262.1 hypothetical protein H2204_005822 [Knufia peltigerae]KIW38336.1 hypothetical protein PV06_09308 [Exophiala oligosperma]
MPEAHGFRVTLATTAGKDYVEFGNQSIGTPSRGRVISSKVLARDGEHFHIKIDFGSAYDNLNPNPDSKPRCELRPIFRNPLDSVNEAGVKLIEHKPHEKPPFKFGVLIHVNGQQRADFAQLLNPDQQSIIVKGRHCVERLKDGEGFNVVVKPWKFTERGIEAMLSNMGLLVNARHSNESTDYEIDEITTALKLTASMKHTAPGGQIVVIIRRCIVLDESPYASGWHQTEETENDIRPNHNTPSITTSKSSTQLKHVKFMTYKQYDPDDEFYAKFVIQALDLPKLVNLNLATPDGEPITQRRRTSGSSLSSGLSSSPLKRIKMPPGDDSESEAEGSTNASINSSNEEDDLSSDEDIRSSKRHKPLVDTPLRLPKATAPKRSDMTSASGDAKEEWMHPLQGNDDMRTEGSAVGDLQSVKAEEASENKAVAKTQDEAVHMG